MSNLVEVTDATFDAEVLGSDIPVSSGTTESSRSRR
jgi:hypothetical protein